MKQPHFSPTIAATILATVLFPGAAIAAGKCDAPKSNVEQRACAKAAQGPDALRQFIWRTRMIYALDYAEFAPAVPKNARSPRGVAIAASSQ